MKYEVILFDLDGTLTESGPGIVNAVEYTLQKYGIDEPDKEKHKRFIGPPLKVSFMKYYGFTEENVAEAVAVFRSYYHEKGIYENSAYPGTRRMLADLSSRGYRLAVATSKARPMAEIVIPRFGLADHLEGIYAAEMDGRFGTKSAVIEHAMEEMGVTDKSKVLMIGDREHDILGAKACGIDSMGVLYGYGSRDELEAAGADMIADTVEDIVKTLDKLK